MEAVLAWQQVTKRFGRQTALDNISLAVPPGVVFALLGENGAGKTTAIRISLGLLAPDSGQSSALGLDSQHDDLQIRQRVGYVAEQPTLYDWMTVDEMGWFAAGFYGGRRIWPHIKNWLSNSTYPRASRSSRSPKACAPRWPCRWRWPMIPIY